ASATYLKLTAPHFRYERAEGPSSPIRMTIPPEVWKGVTTTAGATDWVNAAVTKLSSGAASGPITERWLIAKAKLKGMVYYNSYQSALAMGSGAVLRIKLGGQAELVASGCTVCHTVSANGKVLAAATSYSASSLYDLDLNGNATVRL